MTFYKFRPSDPASISLNEATTGTGAALALNDCRQANWLIEGDGTITNGTVIIESAHDPDYAGTWNELDSIDAATLSGGRLYGNTFPFIPGGFLRGRISENIEGGTVTIRLNGLIG